MNHKLLLKIKGIMNIKILLLKFKELLKRKVDPHHIASGFAVGVFAAFTPLFGVHFVIAIGLAFLFRFNVIAALVGTTINNPLTFPLIYGYSLKIGNYLGFTNTNEGTIMHIAEPLIMGSIILGFITSIMSYFFLLIFINYYRSTIKPTIKKTIMKKREVKK